MLTGKIKFSTFLWRIKSVFEGRLNRIEEVMRKDKEYGIPSVFFFGMNQGLGMTYRADEAKPMIMRVKEAGFDVGVHGIEYAKKEGILKEHECFCEKSDLNIFGIRTHYVRFDEKTFAEFSEAGYLFDSSDFNKEHLDIKKPYKVGKMWEFPLHIMDVYILPYGNLCKGKENTIKAIEEAKRRGMEYCTILYHDYQYNERTYPEEKAWYDWLLDYLHDNNYEFISYREAIKELEEKNA